MDDYVIRVRGMPWSCTEGEVRKFFAGGDDGDGGIESVNFFTRDPYGRPDGQAFIKFRDEKSYDAAFQKDRGLIGHRYVEIFPAKPGEMDYVLRQSSAVMGSAEEYDETVVRLRGLPYQCTKQEIADFFSGLKIVPNGIAMPADDRRVQLGMAFVKFADTDSAEKALRRNRDYIGHRYVEVFRCSLRESMGIFANRQGSASLRGSDQPNMSSWGSSGRYGQGQFHKGFGSGGGYDAGGNSYRSFMSGRPTMIKCGCDSIKIMKAALRIFTKLPK